jgi:hypothetical protein
MDISAGLPAIPVGRLDVKLVIDILQLPMALARVTIDRGSDAIGDRTALPLTHDLLPIDAPPVDIPRVDRY